MCPVQCVTYVSGRSHSELQDSIPFSVARRLHSSQAGNRVIDRFSDIRQHFFRFNVMLVSNRLRVAQGPRVIVIFHKQKGIR